MDVLHGWRLVVTLLTLCTGLLLSSLESTIVSTALVTIGSDFHNYAQSNWVIITYLLAYSSFLIIYARLSDITGRKVAFLTGIGFFTIASLACGLAHTLIELIVFRAFQGIGGAGIFALTMVVVMEITPREQIGLVSGLVNLIFIIASAIGPVLGGAITSRSTWRWCFYLNVPPGAIVFASMLFLFPNTKSSDLLNSGANGKLTSLLRVDWLGLLLMLAATVLVIIPLEEGGDPRPWDSATIIVTFVLGGIFWIAFAVWESYLAFFQNSESKLLPILPLRVVFHRIIGACILTSFGTGLAFTSSVVYLPQRFQFVNGLSPVDAGVKILPLLLISAFGSMVTGLIMGKRNIGFWLILLGNVLQVVGLGLTSTVVSTLDIPSTAYGYQAVLGLGLGTSLSGSFLLARIEVSKKDIASAVGALTQLRLLGGVVGLAICRVSQTSFLNSHLGQVVSPATLQMIESTVGSIASLPAQEAAAVRRTYGEAFDFQWRILTYVSIANVLVGLLAFRRHAKSVHDAEVGVQASDGPDKSEAEAGQTDEGVGKESE